MNAKKVLSDTNIIYSYIRYELYTFRYQQDTD